MVRRLGSAIVLGGVLAALALPAHAQTDLPQLDRPVNDFANIIEPDLETELDRVLRALDRTTGDGVVVATVRTFRPYADIEEYAVKLFENHGRGVGRRGKDNGVLFVMAVDDRQMRIEVGYDLEQFITDGFAGETLREYVAPYLRRGDFSGGVRAGVIRLVERIAQSRNVRLEDLGARPVPVERDTAEPQFPISIIIFIIIFILIAVSNSRANTRRHGRRRHWGGTTWSGWNSGIGPFGSSGGFGGGFGGFGGGGGGSGGFGGFGGGRSGGGGASSGW